MTNLKKVKSTRHENQIGSQEEEERQDIKMYRITKVIFAKNIKDAILNEDKSEIVECTLNEEVTKPNKIGF